MSYQVLARNWRPHDFSSLLGQDHVVRALTHALTQNRLHHAYLFTGTRGVGKTTISRILAKCLNCVGPDGKGGITAEPCGVCEACRAIDEDRFVDYIEMDAASTRGIDDMVSLLERAKYVPTNARFKVYMIDEVHQLTSAAFNAMLKTLEEPPEYVKFILATTDPQKVPVTVLSRCLQFNLKSLSPKLIADHMAELLDKEQILFEKPALRMLAAGARGSMRDGLSLLDQAIAYSAGSVTLEAVREMLGTIDTTTLIRLLGALANHDPKTIMNVADEIGMRSLSYNQAMKDLAVLLHRIAMAQQLPETLTEEEADAADLRRLAQIFSPDEVQLFYQIAIHGRNEMALAPDEYAGFTMSLLRMLAFAPFNGNMPRSLPAALVHQEEADRPKAEPARAEAPEKKQSLPLSAEPNNRVVAHSSEAEASAAPADVPWEPPKEPGKPVFVRENTALPKTSEKRPQPVRAAAAAMEKPAETPSSSTPPWDASSSGAEPIYVAYERKIAAPSFKDSIAQSGKAPGVEQEAPQNALPKEVFIPEDDTPWIPEYEDDIPSYDDISEFNRWDEGAMSDRFPSPEEQAEKKGAEQVPTEPVIMNPWLEAAEKIHLDPSSQPLVTSAELKSFDGKKMTLTVDLEKLTDGSMVAKLADELKKVFGEDFQLTVSLSPSKNQNLRTLYAQRFHAEKEKTLSELKKREDIAAFMKVFKAEPRCEDLDLLDKDGNIRKF